MFKETRAATLENIRRLRKSLARRLEDSCLRAIDLNLCNSIPTLSLSDSIVLAVAELANNAMQHASPKPSYLSVEVQLVGTALRIELCSDGGPFEAFQQVLESSGRVKHSADLICGRGLSLIGQSLQDLEYKSGNPNRIIGWRKLRRARPRVLIIAKQASECQHLQTMLSQNYNTCCACSVHEAKIILSSQKIDVILADYRPDLYLKNIVSTAFDDSPIPVVTMVSPQDFEDNKNHPSYIDQYLQKPVSTSSLIAAIEVAIASYTRRLIQLANYFGRSAGMLLADDLPREFPGFKLATFSGTASYGGGDFGLSLKGSGFTRLILGDIMGHGLKAKAGAIALSSILRTLHYQLDQTADALLQNASHIIANEPAFTEIIATLILVDASEDGWIEAACAGHPPIAIISPEESFVLPMSGPLPGLLPKPVYQLVSYQLRKGDKIAIISDGIDNQAAATAEFPAELLGRLAKDSRRSLRTLKSEMEKWLSGKLGPAPKDDWTLMLAEYCGVPGPALRRRQKVVRAYPAGE